MSKVSDETPKIQGFKAIYERLKFWVHAMILHSIVRTIVEYLWVFVPVEELNGTLTCNLASKKMQDGCWISPRLSTLGHWGEERKATAASFWEDGWFIYWKGWNTLFVYVGSPIGPDKIANYLAPSPTSAPPPKRGGRDLDPDAPGGMGRGEYPLTYLSLLKRDFQVFGLGAERQRFKAWALKPHTEIPITPGKEFALTFSTNVYVSGVASVGAKIDNSRYLVSCTDPTLGVNMRAWEQLRTRAEYVLANSKKYLNMGAPPITNVLLYGPPGTGKTTLVQRLATAMGCSIEFARLPDPDEAKIIPINIDDPEVDVDSWLVYIERYRKLLEDKVELWEARRRETTGWRYSGETVAFRGVSQIVFFDDFDRTFDGMVKGPLLTEMLRFLESRPVQYPVMHIACCNRIDRLPPALLNRFHVVHVEELTTTQIAQILGVWFEDNPGVPDVAHKLTGKLKDLRTLRAAIQQNIPLDRLPDQVEEIYAEARRLHLDSQVVHDEEEEKRNVVDVAKAARAAIDTMIASRKKNGQMIRLLQEQDNQPENMPDEGDDYDDDDD